MSPRILPAPDTPERDAQVAAMESRIEELGGYVPIRFAELPPDGTVDCTIDRDRGYPRTTLTYVRPGQDDLVFEVRHGQWVDVESFEAATGALSDVLVELGRSFTRGLARLGIDPGRRERERAEAEARFFLAGAGLGPSPVRPHFGHVHVNIGVDTEAFNAAMRLANERIERGLMGARSGDTLEITYSVSLTDESAGIHHIVGELDGMTISLPVTEELLDGDMGWSIVQERIRHELTPTVWSIPRVTGIPIYYCEGPTVDGWVTMYRELAGGIRTISIREEAFGIGSERDWEAVVREFDPNADHMPWLLGMESEAEDRTEPEEIPDVTPEDRERWHRATVTAPDGPDEDYIPDGGGGISTDELLGIIDLALTQNREEMDDGKD